MTPEQLKQMSRQELKDWLLSISDEANDINWGGQYRQQPPNYLLLEIMAHDEEWSLTLPQLQAFAAYVCDWIRGPQ